MTINKAKSNHNFEVAVENYLKAIWNLECANSGNPVLGAAIAKQLDVTPPSVTNMLNKLFKLGLLVRPLNRKVKLSCKGRKKVAHLLRKHQLVEMFLEKTLKLTPSELHNDAELLEHAVSNELLEHMNKFLNNPTQDNNGMPIVNDSSLSNTFNQDQLLKFKKPGHSYKITAIADYHPKEFLKLQSKGIKAGTQIKLISISPKITIETNDKAQISLTEMQSLLICIG